MPISPQEYDRALTVGQLARRSGVAVSTIHFYETKGLIKGWRTQGNQRRYQRDALRRIAVIRTAQQLGISLNEIQKVLDALPGKRTPTMKDWQDLSRQWRQDLETRIERLQALRSQLTECIGCGCLSLQKCHLRNSWDKLGDSGSGPVLLNTDQKNRSRKK
ncbi:MAG TPA: redox-sensitive transcriptional activator SoxR [Steroidobacteraceae bacterium]|jgi:MerR family redox-sensitive transcriptional activator SoxR|nr:redox-sensitive transcriptional activator SoxR [Steroidobacteraceae bacterium]